MFHAVPSWLAQRGLLTSSRSHTLVPLVFSTAAIGRGKPASLRRWHAWEFSVRPFTDATSDQILSALSSLLSSPCTCFDRFEATAHAFNPAALDSPPRLREFRQAALKHARHVFSLPRSAGAYPQAERQVARRDIIYISRTGGRRAVSNERVLLRIRNSEVTPLIHSSVA